MEINPNSRSQRTKRTRNEQAGASAQMRCPGFLFSRFCADRRWIPPKPDVSRYESAVCCQQLRKLQDRKEVRKMKYERPEIVLETPAHSVIQANKNNTMIPDGDQPRFSVPAYEADE